MPFFSVIVPLYNKEKYIQNAIQSILNQSFSDFELLIVNDCSTDNSLLELEKINSDKIRVIHHQVNKGLAATRNTGIKNAQSNYITFLDADDEWCPDFLKSIHHLIHNFSDAKIYATNYQEIWDTTIKYPFNGSENLVPDFKGYLNFFKINLKQGIYCHGSVCFHKEVFEKVGYYNESIRNSEDLDFNIRANYHFQLAYDATQLMVYHMQTENQLTRINLKNKTIPDFDIYEVWSKNKPELKKYLDFERYVLGKRLKKCGDVRWKKMLVSIDYQNLNWKQKILLKLPKVILLRIDDFKRFLLKYNFKISTYS